MALAVFARALERGFAAARPCPRRGGAAGEASQNRRDRRRRGRREIVSQDFSPRAAPRRGQRYIPALEEFSFLAPKSRPCRGTVSRADGPRRRRAAPFSGGATRVRRDRDNRRPAAAGVSRGAAARKRAGIEALARTIRRLHGQGFVHGDLVASNIFVAANGDREIHFYFMDNDRTRRFPRWLPQSLWKRNLIQLNRLPLPGITLQDRMRFLRAYLGAAPGSRRERDFARWIEHRTRRRRRECDGVEQASFRELMRWRGMPQS